MPSGDGSLWALAYAGFRVGTAGRQQPVTVGVVTDADTVSCRGWSHYLSRFDDQRFQSAIVPLARLVVPPLVAMSKTVIPSMAN